MKTSDSEVPLADDCQKCAAMSDGGGYRFGCVSLCPSKAADRIRLEDLHATQFVKRSLGAHLTERDTMEGGIQSGRALQRSRQASRSFLALGLPTQTQ